MSFNLLDSKVNDIDDKRELQTVEGQVTFTQREVKTV